MKNIIYVILVLAGFSSSAATAYLGYLYPSGGQRGTTVRVVTGGQRMGKNIQLLTSQPGLTLKSAVQVPNVGYIRPWQKKWLVNWMKNIADGKREKPERPELTEEQDWKEIPWFEELNQLLPLEYSLVSEMVFVPRNELQAAPSIANRLVLEIEIAPDAPIGMHRIRLADNGRVTNEKLFFVDECKQIDEPLFQPPFVKKAPVPEVKKFPAVLNGQVMPGECDTFELTLEKGTPYTFAMIASELSPYLGDAVPGHFQGVLSLADESGREVAFADDEYHHPDPVLRFTPEKSGKYTLRIFDSLRRGRADFVYRITADKGTAVYRPCKLVSTYRPAVKTVKADSVPSVLQNWKDGLDITGALTAEKQTFKIAGRKGEKAVFELFGARIDSPLDSVLVLRDENNRVVAENDDMPPGSMNIDVCRRHVDAEISFTFPADGVYTLTLADRNGACGADYRYILQIRAPMPGVMVVAPCSVVSFGHTGWGRVKLHVIRRDGFNGAVTIGGADFKTLKKAVIPAGKDEAYVPLLLKNPQYSEIPQPFALEAEYTVNGKKETIRVIPADEAMQAFAYTHLLPAENFYRLIRAPKKTAVPSKK